MDASNTTERDEESVTNYIRAGDVNPHRASLLVATSAAGLSLGSYAAGSVSSAPIFGTLGLILAVIGGALATCGSLFLLFRSRLSVD